MTLSGTHPMEKKLAVVRIKDGRYRGKCEVQGRTKWFPRRATRAEAQADVDAYRNKPDLSTLANTSGTLIFDIESAPAHIELDTYDLKLRNPWIHHSNVVRPGRMVAWAAQWLHEPNTVHYADCNDPDMLHRLWDLLDRASYAVTYNGDNFDLKKVRQYFLRAGFPPYRPPKSIDLIKTVRTFGLESNSLDYACRMFATDHQKHADIGAGGWAEVEAGDPEARKMMRRYCTGDVRATTDLFVTLLPWAKLPAMGSTGRDELHCPRCLSTDYMNAGSRQAIVLRYRMYRCQNCRGLFTGAYHSRVSRSKAA